MSLTMVNGVGGQVSAGRTTGTISTTGFGSSSNMIINGKSLKPTPVTVTYKWMTIPALIRNNGEDANGQAFINSHLSYGCLMANYSGTFMMCNVGKTAAITAGVEIVESLPAASAADVTKIYTIDGNSVYRLVPENTETVTCTITDHAIDTTQELITGTALSNYLLTSPYITVNFSDCDEFNLTVTEAKPETVPAAGTFSADHNCGTFYFLNYDIGSFTAINPLVVWNYPWNAPLESMLIYVEERIAPDKKWSEYLDGSTHPEITWNSTYNWYEVASTAVSGYSRLILGNLDDDYNFTPVGKDDVIVVAGRSYRGYALKPIHVLTLNGQAKAEGTSFSLRIEHNAKLETLNNTSLGGGYTIYSSYEGGNYMAMYDESMGSASYWRDTSAGEVVANSTKVLTDVTYTFGM